MKSKKEIEGLAIEHAHLKPNFDRVEEEYYNIGAINAYESFIQGYTKCQEDMATILFNISKLINESEYTEYSRLTDIKDYIKSLNKQD